MQQIPRYVPFFCYVDLCDDLHGGLRHLRLLDRATNKAYGDPRELPHNKMREG